MLNNCEKPIMSDAYDLIEAIKLMMGRANEKELGILFQFTSKLIGNRKKD